MKWRSAVGLILGAATLAIAVGTDRAIINRNFSQAASPASGLSSRIGSARRPLRNEVVDVTSSTAFPLEGGCDCGQIRYRMETAPLIVHCCHCRWCQRESGAAFALNALIETERVVHLQAEPQIIDTPSLSGRGQKIARCPTCRLALWSHYAGAGPVIRFIRVGTLDTPEVLRPDIHIFTASKQPWVVLPPDAPAVSEYYEIERCWSPESLARRELFLPRLRAYRAEQGF